MSAYLCWMSERERLREALQAAADTTGAVYATRHTLAQVEQNTMAEQPDDLLRQQTGILFSCLKTSINLLDISITTQVWVAQSQVVKSKASPSRWFLAIAILVQVVVALFAYLRADLFVWVPLAGSIIVTALGWIVLGRKAKAARPGEDRLKVSAHPDTAQLFHAIDAQMQAIDRHINDFAYLNDQIALRYGASDVQHVPELATLMEAIYANEGDAGEEAVNAAEQLLDRLGVRAVQYDSTQSQRFTVLPSITQTNTLTPALVSKKDGTLLYRGTAAVLQTPMIPQPSTAPTSESKE